MKILVIEDDLRIASLLKSGLERTGSTVDVCHTGLAGRQYLLAGFYDVLILDVKLPDVDGIALSKQLRDEQIDMPILMLTARDSIQDKVAGLTNGADDYLTKPFSFEELNARLTALTRRPAQFIQQSALCVGNLTLDRVQKEVRVSGEVVTLTRKEFAVLELLLRNLNQVMSREIILDRVWSTDFEPEANVVDAIVARLRTKIDHHAEGSSLIKTVRGIGYVIRI